MTDEAQGKGERIAKVLARAGVASRRDAEKLIDARRVAVNGTVLTTPAVVVGPDDVVTVDGAPLKAREPARLWRYHKPAGLVTTHKDPQGRPTVFERLPRELGRVISVGRLDLNSEGLLLLTNDGELARALEHPERGWVRRYRVRVHGTVDEARLATLANGVTVDGVRYGPITAVLERQQGANAWVGVSLAEGKNREVRRVMEHLGYTVNRLLRVAYGPFILGRLERGAVEEVPTKVLRAQLGSTDEAIPEELRARKVNTTGWARAKARPAKPGEKARERALARGEGFKKGESTRKAGRGEGEDAARPETPARKPEAAPEAPAKAPRTRRPERAEQRSEGRPERRSEGRPARCPDDRAEGRPERRPEGRPDRRPDDRGEGRPARRPEGRSGKPSGNPPSGRPGDRPSGRSGARPSGRPGSRPGPRPSGRPDRTKP